MRSFVFDCEGDGLKPSKFHCLSAASKRGNIKTTTEYKNMRSFLTSADVLIGHNIILWDIPHLERVLGVKVKARIVDTLALSWYLFPNRARHGLEVWGEELGVLKPQIDDWENQTLEEYKHRCEQDVKINLMLWDKCWNYLVNLYGSPTNAWGLIDYLSFKMKCVAMAEKSGWKLDVDYVYESLSEMKPKLDQSLKALAEIMPDVPVKVIKKPPAKPFKKDGSHSASGLAWKALLKERGLPESFNGEIEVIRKYEPANPQSSDQIKSWLFSLGWSPETFDYKKNEDGTTREIPQVRVEGNEGKELCQSVLKLANVEPGISHLQGVTVLSHRISLLEGFLKAQEDGWIKAQVGGLTNTLRFKHRTLVNLPGVGKLYGEKVRGALTAPVGYELCGADISSLEDRTKQHFMWEYDPEYVKEMMTDDFDPHLDIAVSAKLLTIDQANDHKAGRKSYKAIRHSAKTANYSCTYGAAASTIARKANIPLDEAERLHSGYWDRNWSIRAIADACIVKKIGSQKWLFNPVSNLWYSLRAEKDRFSTLNQGTGSFLFDMWVKEVIKERPQLTGQFHDEWITCIKLGHRKDMEDIARRAMDRVNKTYKLNRELDLDVQFGKNYAEIH